MQLCYGDGTRWIQKPDLNQPLNRAQTNDTKLVLVVASIESILWNLLQKIRLANLETTYGSRVSLLPLTLHTTTTASKTIRISTTQSRRLYLYQKYNYDI